MVNEMAKKKISTIDILKMKNGDNRFEPAVTTQLDNYSNKMRKEFEDKYITNIEQLQKMHEEFETKLFETKKDILSTVVKGFMDTCYFENRKLEEWSKTKLEEFKKYFKEKIITLDIKLSLWKKLFFLSNALYIAIIAIILLFK